jgi:type IV pilus biogenesis protein PilP
MSCRSLLRFLLLLAFILIASVPELHAGNATSDLQSDITLRELSHKRARLELRKIEVQLAREEKELEKLRKKPTPDPPKQPVHVAARPVKRPAPRPVVVSVQGSGGGELSATLKMRRGLLTVHKGDRVRGGVVESIRTDRVTMRFNGKSVPLMFQE